MKTPERRLYYGFSQTQSHRVGISTDVSHIRSSQQQKDITYTLNSQSILIIVIFLLLTFFFLTRFTYISEWGQFVILSF